MYYEAMMNILENNQLQTIFQPIVSLTTDEIIGYEALSRITGDSIFKHIGEFIEEVKFHDKEKEFELLTLKNAIREYQGNNEGYLYINMSFPTFLKCTDEINGLLKEAIDVNGIKIRVEFSENHYINTEAMEKVNQIIAEVKSPSLQFGIDDYGTHYGSLEKIINIDFHFIKIGLEIIKNIHSNEKNITAIEMLRYFKQKHAVDLIAEGIETPQQLNILQQLEVDNGQGYLFGGPQ